MFRELHKIAEAAREVLALWMPIMITQPDEATHLSEFARLHRRIVQLLRFLARESNWPIAISESEVTEKLVMIIEMAAEQDHDLFQVAEQLSSLD
jgi:hypothetical protein